MIDTIVLNTRDNIRLICTGCGMGSWAGVCFIESVTIEDRTFLPGAMLCLYCGLLSLRSARCALSQMETPRVDARGVHGV